jgi:hypothetical protein
MLIINLSVIRWLEKGGGLFLTIIPKGWHRSAVYAMIFRYTGPPATRVRRVNAHEFNNLQINPEPTDFAGSANRYNGYIRQSLKRDIGSSVAIRID